MTNRSVGRTFLSTGHPLDRSWMESGQTRPSLEGKGAPEYEGFWNGIHGKWVRFSTTQPGRRKRHADDGTLGGRYTDVKRNVENVQWDDSQKRILFESEDLESVSSGSDSQEVDRVGPRLTWARIHAL